MVCAKRKGVTAPLEELLLCCLQWNGEPPFSFHERKSTFSMNIKAAMSAHPDKVRYLLQPLPG